MTKLLCTLLFICSGMSFGDTQQKEINCLAQTIYFEARSEPVEGQYAVGLVALNRVQSPQFPNTLCGVTQQAWRDEKGQPIKYKCQFSFYCDGEPEHVKNEKAWILAWTLAEGLVRHRPFRDITNGALYYHADYVSLYWAIAQTQTVQIDTHIFYK